MSAIFAAEGPLLSKDPFEAAQKPTWPMAAEEVRMVRRGEKTQMRLPLRKPVESDWDGALFIREGVRRVDSEGWVRAYSEYQIGDLLWVREPMALAHAQARDDEFELRYPADDGDGIVHRVTPNDGQVPLEGCRPGRATAVQLPQWASRAVIEIVAVRVERLRVITGDDAIAEGAPVASWNTYAEALAWFKDRWDRQFSFRGYGFVADPWVVAHRFRVVALRDFPGGPLRPGQPLHS